MACRPRWRNRTEGFTLVELLVVISIIMLLVGLVLPVVNKGLKRAKAVKSLSNLRQIGLAITNYTLDNDDFLPTMTESTPWTKPYWTDMIKPYIQDYDPESAQSLWSRPEIYTCPYWKDHQHQVTADYGANWYVIRYVDDPTDKPIRSFHIPNPSGVVMVSNSNRDPNGSFGAGGTWFVRTPVFISDPSPTGDAYPQPIFDNQVHCLFVDGHVAALPWDDVVEQREDLFGTDFF